MARSKSTANDPSAQDRAVVYARVSTREQEQEGYSIDAQLALLRAYAERSGIVIVREFVEAESAKVSNRPAFAEMLREVKASSIPVILVEKTDRLYRNLKDHVRVDDLDVAVHLVKEGEIISRDSKSHQKFVHGIKLLVSKNYSDNLSEEARKGMAEKAKQGIWPTKAPLGYLNVSVGSRRVIEPDPERKDHIIWLFHRYAEGNISIRDLRDEAAARGLTTRKGRKVQANAIHKILQHKAYVGIVEWGEIVVPGIHEPLVDKATFQRVQDIMSGRNTTKAKPASELDFLYKGLFTCGKCGCQISPQRTKGHVYYACTGSKGCPRPTVREEVITEAIAERLSQMTIRPEVLALLRRALLESNLELADYRKRELVKLKTRQDELERKLQRLYEDHVQGVVGVSAYSGLRSQWELELAKAESLIQAHSASTRKMETEGVDMLDMASNAYSRFKSASRDDQREMARHLLSNSTITDRNVQVCLHEAFEMILTAHQEIPENAPNSVIVEKWLPDRDSNPN